MSEEHDPTNPLVGIYVTDYSFQSLTPQLRNLSPRPLLVAELPVLLLHATSCWAESQVKNGQFSLKQYVPHGTSWWAVQSAIEWLKRVGEALGNGPMDWGEIFEDRESGVVRKVCEMHVRRKDQDNLRGWMELYFAFVVLGIHGGPLDGTRAWLLNRVSEFVQSPYLVLDKEDLVRLWEVLYLIPESVSKEEEQVLSAALAKAAKAFEGSLDLEHDYLWTIEGLGRLDLMNMFTGLMVTKGNYRIPPKEEELEEGVAREMYGAVPALAMEGEPSEGLDDRKAYETEKATKVINETEKLFVGWTPSVRYSCVVEEPFEPIARPMSPSKKPQEAASGNGC